MMTLSETKIQILGGRKPIFSKISKNCTIKKCKPMRACKLLNTQIVHICAICMKINHAGMGNWRKK